MKPQGFVVHSISIFAFVATAACSASESSTASASGGGSLPGTWVHSVSATSSGQPVTQTQVFVFAADNTFDTRTMTKMDSNPVSVITCATGDYDVHDSTLTLHVERQFSNVGRVVASEKESEWRDAAETQTLAVSFPDGNTLSIETLGATSRLTRGSLPSGMDCK